MEEFKMKPQAVCPVCGGDVEVMIHPTNPPQTHYKCLKCGRHKDIWHKQQEPEIAPL